MNHTRRFPFLFCVEQGGLALALESTRARTHTFTHICQPNIGGNSGKHGLLHHTDSLSLFAFLVFHIFPIFSFPFHSSFKTLTLTRPACSLLPYFLILSLVATFSRLSLSLSFSLSPSLSPSNVSSFQHIHGHNANLPLMTIKKMMNQLFLHALGMIL